VKHNSPGQYLSTAQQYPEMSALLWLQGLAQCRKTAYMYATKLTMQLYADDVQ